MNVLVEPLVSRKKNSKPVKEIFMFIILILSTFMATSVNGQGNEIEFTTNGELLMLDSETKSIIGVDFEPVMNGGIFDENILSNITLTHVDQLVKPIDIAHDSSNLFILYDDRTFEVYSSANGQGSNHHWVRENAITLASDFNSVQTIDNNILAFTMDDEESIVIVMNTDTDGDGHPDGWGVAFSNPETIYIGATMSGASSGLLGVTNIEMQSDGYYTVEALSSDGLTMIRSSSPSNSLSAVQLATDRMWISGNLDSFRSPTPALSMDNVEVKYDGDDMSLTMVWDGRQFRILKMQDRYQRAVLATSSNHVALANESAPFAITEIVNGQSVASTILDIREPDSSADSRCLPLRVHFKDFDKFTYQVNNQIFEEGEVNLSIAGIEKTVEWDDISGQIINWDEEDVDSLFDDLCRPYPDQIEVRIVDSFPENLNARIELEGHGLAFQPGPSKVTPVYPNFQSGLIEYRDSSGANSGKIGDSIPIFGANGMGIMRTIDTNVDSKKYHSFSFSAASGPFPVLSQPNSVDISFNSDVRVIQSIIEPSVVTQGKRMWWEVNASEDSPSGESLVDVQILIRGVECTVLAQPIQSFPRLMVRNNLEDISSQPFCRTELRQPGDWEPINEQYPFADTAVFVGMCPGPDGALVTCIDADGPDHVEVTVIDMKLPFGQATVIPFHGTHDNTNYSRWSITPAGPASENFISNGAGGGLVEWKIIVDSESAIEPTPVNRQNNAQGGEVDTIRFELETLDIMIVPVSLSYTYCGGPMCLPEWPVTRDAPDRDWIQQQIEHAELKIQEMFPIPEGSVNIIISDNDRHVEVTDEFYTDHLNPLPIVGTNSMLDFIPFGGAELDWYLHRTISRISLLDEGLTWRDELGNPPDYIMPLTDDISWTQAERDSKDYIYSEFQLDGDPYDPDPGLHGAWYNGAMSPCSPSIPMNDRDDLADTIVHEMGHALFMMHDGFDLGTSTLNNCGYLDTRQPGERTDGWSSTNFIGGGFEGTPPNRFWTNEVDPTVKADTLGSSGSYHQSQSFMRYRSDIDPTTNTLAPVEEFEFRNNWIQDEDYVHLQNIFNEQNVRPWHESYLCSLSEGAINAGLSSSGIEEMEQLLDDIIIAYFDALENQAEELLSLEVDLDFLIQAINDEDTLQEVLEYFSTLLMEQFCPEWVENRDSGRSVSDGVDEINMVQFTGFMSDNGGIEGGLQSSSSISRIKTENWNETQQNIVLIDNSGNVIHSTTTQTNPIMNQLLGVTMLSATIPGSNLATGWELLDYDGSVLDSGQIDSAPTLQFDVLPNSVPLGSIINLEWNLQGDSNIDYSYDIRMSDDGGNSWKSIGNDLLKNTYSFSTSIAHLSSNLSFEIIANNGIHTINEQSSLIRVSGSQHELNWISNHQLKENQQLRGIVTSNGDNDNCQYLHEGSNVVERVDGNRVRLLIEPTISDLNNGIHVTIQCENEPDAVIIIGRPIVENQWESNANDVEHQQINHNDLVNLQFEITGIDSSDIREKLPYGDFDRDGVFNINDQCHNSNLIDGESVDEFGCKISIQSEPPKKSSGIPSVGLLATIAIIMFSAIITVRRWD